MTEAAPAIVIEKYPTELDRQVTNKDEALLWLLGKLCQEHLESAMRLPPPRRTRGAPCLSGETHAVCEKTIPLTIHPQNLAVNSNAAKHPALTWKLSSAALSKASKS